MWAGMMTFWAIAAVLAAGVAATLAGALLVRGRGPAAREGRDYDIAVYRDQLAEVDRDVARGMLDPEAAERTRTEVSRRILEADRGRSGAPDGAAPGWSGIAGALAIAAVAGAGSLGLYALLGAPGYGDLPRADRLAAAAALREARPGQAAAEEQAAARRVPLPAPDPDFAALVEQLRVAMAGRPDDVRGLGLLARNEATLGNYAAARAAQERLVAAKGAEADAADHVDLADLLILAAGGYVSPEAEAALEAALALDPADGPARYYTGLLHLQTGRPDLAFRTWRALLADSPDGAPWVPAVEAQIGDAAARAGIRYAPEAGGVPTTAPTTAPATDLQGGPPATLDGALPGPDAAQVGDAAAMDPAARAEMIEGMVAGLSDRLAREGGTPAEWARLIGALGVLGRTEGAAAIWAEAQDVFAGSEAALSVVRAAARQAGVDG